MTGRACGMLLFGGGMILLSLLRGDAALFLLGALPLCLLAAALLSCLLMLLTLRFSCELPRAEADRGQAGELVLRFSAHGLPCRPLTLRLTLPGRPPEDYLIPVHPFGRTQTRVPFPCGHVGVYTLEAGHAVVSDCFGLFRVPCPRRGLRRSFTVLPVPRAAALPDSGGLQRPSVLREPDTDAPDGLRDWREGDDLRRVHWKLTLRRGELTVRTHEALRRPELLLFLAVCAPTPPRAFPDLRDALCEAAAGAMEAAALRGGALRLSLPGEGQLSFPALQAGDLPALRRHLAAARLARAGDTAARLLSAASGAAEADAVLFLCDRPDAACADALLRLRASGVSCRAVLCGDAPPQAAIAARLAAGGVPCVSPAPAEGGAS